MPKYLSDNYLKCGLVPERDTPSNTLCHNAAIELTRAGMRVVNFGPDCRMRFAPLRWEYCYPQWLGATSENHPTKYYSVTGESWRLDIKPTEATLPWKSDSWESWGIPFPEQANVDGIFGESHTTINTSEEVYEYISAIIKDDSANVQAASASAAAPTASTIAVNSPPLPTEEDDAIISTQGGALAANEQRAVSVLLDGSEEVTFRVVSTAPFSVTLIDPVGRPIDSTTVVTGTGGTYNEWVDTWNANEVFYNYTYVLPSPVAGNWQYVLQASAVEGRFFGQSTVRSSTRFYATTERSAYRPGDLITIEAALIDASDVLTNTQLQGVATSADGITTTLTLVDNGTSGDTLAGDGIYGAQFTAEQATGYTVVILTATHGDTVRFAEALMLVGAQTGRIVAVTGAQAPDANRNALFDSLDISVVLTTTVSGHFSLAGTLVDENGTPLASARFASRRNSGSVLASGAHTVTLSFPSTSINRAAKDGFYRVINLRLSDDTGVSIPVDTVTEAYTTSVSYLASQFDPEPRDRLPVSLSNVQVTTPDSDSDGLYDSLRVQGTLAATVPGTYQWQAELRDRAGLMISALQGSPVITQPQSLMFTFSGATIRNSGAQGPYSIHLAFGTATPRDRYPQLHTTVASTPQQFDGPDTCDVLEPDNALLQATPLTFDTLQSSSLCSQTDSDAFRLFVPAGLPTRIELGAITAGRAWLKLYASDGLTAIDETTSTSLPVPIATSDTYYYVQVVARNITLPLAYTMRHVSVSCPSDAYEPNNFPVQAQSLPLGTTQSHITCFAYDADWVWFDTQPGMLYRVEALNLTARLDLELYASDGQTRLARVDGAAPLDETRGETRIDYPASIAGRLYVRISDYALTTGNPYATYNLRVTAVDWSNCTDEAIAVDNTSSQARPATAGRLERGALCGAYDADWIAFPVTAGLTYEVVAFNLDPDTDTVFAIYDQLGWPTGWQSEATYRYAAYRSFQADESRTLYLKVYPGDGHSAVNSRYHVRIRALQCADSFEPDGSAATSSMLTEGETHVHGVCPSGSDSDWMRFQTVAGHTYRLDAFMDQGAAVLGLQFFAAGQTTPLVTRQAFSYEGARIEFTAALSGTYYLKAQLDAGYMDFQTDLYTLTLTSVDPSMCQESEEPNDVWTQAQPVITGIPLESRFCMPGDADWYVFTATADTFYRVTTTSTVLLNGQQVELYASDGTTLLAETSTGTTNVFEFTSTAPDTYYLRVRHRWDGGFPDNTYTLQIEPQVCLDTYEPDGSSATASLFTLDVPQDRTLCGAADNDWVHFTAEADVPCQIETQDLGTYDTDTYLEVYDQDGITLLVEDDNSGDYWPASRVVFTPTTAGSYYVKVRHATGGGHPSFTYRLTMRAVLCNDAYEPNDTSANAAVFPIDTTQSHAFCQAGDEDWSRITVEAGTLYRFETGNLADGVDTIISLYASDGATLLAMDDDGGGGLASRIDYTASANVTLYLQVRHYSSWAGDPAYLYELTAGAEEYP